ncbi:hypothetical protein AB0I72_25240 [Nocardiopsis sp. NPDC049922]|uniref:hypothetical protein n=1 Tax=Nocardiopsis sp. NPDC049922 TaxID=3155157 RepID=UPI0033E94DBF
MQPGPAPYPAPQPVPPPAPRSGTGRTVGITVAVTLAAFVLVAGAVGAAFALTGSGAATPEPEFDELPAEPCAAATRSELGAVSATLGSQSYHDGAVSCDWYAEFSDGTVGYLRVAFRLPTDDDYEPVVDEEAAERQYAADAENLLGETDSEYAWLEVIESDELDLGDESLVSHNVDGPDDEPQSEAEVLARVGTVLVSVTASEPYGNSTGEADFTGDEELLIAIAERAVALLEETE